MMQPHTPHTPHLLPLPPHHLLPLPPHHAHPLVKVALQPRSALLQEQVEVLNLLLEVSQLAECVLVAPLLLCSR